MFLTTSTKRSGSMLKTLFLMVLVTTSCGEQKNQSEIKNIFGQDAREELSVHSYPGSAIGRLDVGCSSVMVGKTLAVTAAHCVVDQVTGKMLAQTKFIEVGYSETSSVAKAWIVGAWVGALKPEEDRKNDWAVLLLADDVGSRSGWFGVGEVDTTSSLPFTVSTAGYGTDKNKGRTLMVSKDCYIHKIDDSGRLLHDCDGATGVSGGPMYTYSNSNGATLVALTVAEFRRGQQSMSLPRYSHDLANIGVNGSSLRAVLDVVQPLIGIGAAVPPRIEGAVFLVNHNSNPGDVPQVPTNINSLPPPQVVPQPILPPQTTPPPVDRYQVLLSKVIFESGSILNESNRMFSNVALIESYASQRGYSNLSHQASALKSMVSNVSLNAYNLNVGAVDRSAGVNVVVNQVINLAQSTSSFVDFVNGVSVMNPAISNDLSALIFEIQMSLSRLIDKVSVQS
jgi:V8-like Glu-specific endopeptidase